MQQIDPGKTIDFVGIGAPRSGTTWVSVCLNEHPDISIPEIKESYFFSRHTNKGVQWYKELFSNFPKNTQWGEFTTDYYRYPRVAHDLISLNPNIKIIVCLRNPVDMVFSLHHYAEKHAGRTKTFEERLADADDWFITAGYYFHHLSLFLEPFHPDNVHVILLDDFKKNSEHEIKKIYQFLGVDHTFVPPSIHAEINRTKQFGYYSLRLQRLSMKKFTLRQYVVWDYVVYFAHKINLDTLIARLMRFNRTGICTDALPVLTKNERELLVEKYRSDIGLLSQYLDRDLSHWLKLK